MDDLPVFRDPVRLSRRRIFPTMRERRRRILAALAASLFGGFAAGVMGQLVLAPFAEIHSWAVSLAVWAMAVLLGALLGAPVLQGTLDRFDYGISYHAAAAALFAGQVQSLLFVWLHLGDVVSSGVLSVIASALVVLVVMSFVRTRATVEPR
ncbi:MAG TPA: hypothetical protein VFR32_11395 [Gaiellaceae bacterium]|nr:hypothetical protein [Gaiellaceae bacterium]